MARELVLGGWVWQHATVTSFAMIIIEERVG